MLNEAVGDGELGVLRELLPHPYLRLSAELSLVSANRAASERLQLGGVEEGLAPWATDPELQASNLEGLCRAAQESGEVQAGEIVLSLRAKKRVYTARVAPCEEGIAVLLVDVTAERQAEQERDDLLAQTQRAELASGVGTYEWDVGTKAFFASPAALRIFGFPPDAQIGMGEALSRIHQTDREGAFPLTEGPLDPYLGYAEYRVTSPDGETRWIGRQAGLMCGPDGEPWKVVGAIRDITERRRADDQVKFQARLLDVVGHAVIATDADGQVLYWNEAAERIYGWSAEEALGRNVIELKATSDDPDEAKRLLSSLQNGESWSGEIRLKRKDGTSFIAYVSDTPILDDEGRLAAIVGVSADVSDRKRAEEHLHLMVNELNHRVKNTLATVQSVTAQTLRNAGTPVEVASTLTDRLLALSKAHDVLTNRQWQGAELGEIAAKAAEPYQPEGGTRFSFHGPRIQLPPNKAIAFSLALHELATNAIKYGSLSVPEGQATLDWFVIKFEDHQELRVTWREQGGPPVKPPPRQGFGSRLIKRNLATELEGTVELTYDAAGVVCTMTTRLPRDQTPTDAPKFVVTPRGDGWQVTAGRVVSEVFETQRHAIAFVTRELETLRTSGRGGAVVFQQDKDAPRRPPRGRPSR